VRLKDISRLRNDLLLNERLVAHYLSQVAPIPFAPEFTFGSQIEKKLAARTNRHPLELVIAGEKLYRPHRDEMIFPGKYLPAKPGALGIGPLKAAVGTLTRPRCCWPPEGGP